MGSTSPPAHTMVATKVLISLCVVTLASAQSQQVIVNDVVTALQPSIARAVAEALRGLGGSSSSNRFSSSSTTGFASGSSGSSSSGSRFSSAGATGAVGAAEPTTRPEYNYEFKVADEEEQTFISQSETRDGDDVTGTYSYVDANGDLITVNYQAGLDGYTQTLDKQEGVVQMRVRPSKSEASSSGQTFQSSRGSSSSRGQSFGGSSSRGQTFFNSFS